MRKIGYILASDKDFRETTNLPSLPNKDKREHFEVFVSNNKASRLAEERKRGLGSPLERRSETTCSLLDRYKIICKG